ncbi:MAG: HIT family protein [Firmicutes bacterium HGW-Firmicutes-3]|jgi:histidine triad (HIT) family protein|nr:MAG: HIT family protein [Firmicutes bacterium HGW-Firmicutes-3]
MSKCLFCSIASGDLDSATIFESSEFRVILDKFPSGKGHTLILPKEHIENIYDLDGETAGKMFALATVISKALKKVLKCDGLNILQNNGVAAGQTVMHFHLHLIPRFEEDGINFKWKTKAFSDDQMLELVSEISKEI